MPGILQAHLPLNLATHNPIVAVVFLHASAVFAAEQDLGLRQLEWPASALLILMFWGALFSWEIARKIRAPEEENAYVTYSPPLGPHRLHHGGVGRPGRGSRTRPDSLGSILVPENLARVGYHRVCGCRLGRPPVSCDDPPAEHHGWPRSQRDMPWHCAWRG